MRRSGIGAAATQSQPCIESVIPPPFHRSEATSRLVGESSQKWVWVSPSLFVNGVQRLRHRSELGSRIVRLRSARVVDGLPQPGPRIEMIHFCDGEGSVSTGLGEKVLLLSGKRCFVYHSTQPMYQRETIMTTITVVSWCQFGVTAQLQQEALRSGSTHCLDHLTALVALLLSKVV